MNGWPLREVFLKYKSDIPWTSFHQSIIGFISSSLSFVCFYVFTKHTSVLIFSARVILELLCFSQVFGHCRSRDVHVCYLSRLRLHCQWGSSLWRWRRGWPIAWLISCDAKIWMSAPPNQGTRCHNDSCLPSSLWVLWRRWRWSSIGFFLHWFYISELVQKWRDVEVESTVS